MTHTLVDQMALDQAVFFAEGEFGEAAAYTPPGGGASTAVIVVTGPSEAEADGRRGHARRAVRKLWVPSTACTPAYQGVFTIAGAAWTVAAVDGPLDGDWECEIERDVRLRMD